MTSYAKKLNTLIQDTFDLIRKNENDLAEAKDKATNVSRNKDDVSIAKAAAADAAVVEAESRIKQFRVNSYKIEQKADALLKEYENYLADEYAVKADQVDEKTIHLLNSGILSLYDYEKLYEEAEKQNNITMMRLIGAAADKAGEAYKGVEGARYSTIAIRSRQAAGGTEKELFLGIVNAFKRSINNPAMIESWDEITGGVIDEL